MKLDFYMPAAPIDEAGPLARWAADVGFDGFFTAEIKHDPFLPLAVGAAHENRLEYGTGIAVAFPRSPMTTAYLAWDLAALTGGRFLLGLGTQVKAHIVRRFSGEWVSPGPRLAEYVAALRAIWASWQNGEPLKFEGDHYSFSLMTPFFDPGPIENPAIPIYIAAVGAWMSRMAGEVCDGLHVHPFHTIRYLDGSVLPELSAGAARAGKSANDVVAAASVFVVTGRNEKELEESKLRVRSQIAFYASTPTYRSVLEMHGWDFGDRLSAMSRTGQWAAMADLISDEVLNEVAVVAPLDELGAAVAARYRGRLGRLAFYAGEPSWTADQWGTLLESTRRALS